ncbi:MAG: Gx transporter family protein [Oscillospiraceae bacterium]|nr:Gx transporter family protein [Oscillospiraceae bacterium]
MKMPLRRLAHMAVLTAIALTIFMVEAQIPVPLPVPGVKLGLANIVTVYAMFALGPAPTLLILAARIILGAVFSGRVVALLYSASGGLLCYLAMLGMRRILTPRQIWICSVIGAMFHNAGQILAAIFVLRATGIVAYLPVLLISAIASGVFTGVCAQLLVNRLGDMLKVPKNLK